MLVIKVLETQLYIAIINTQIPNAHCLPDTVLGTKETEIKGYVSSSKSSQSRQERTCKLVNVGRLY